MLDMPSKFRHLWPEAPIVISSNGKCICDLINNKFFSLEIALVQWESRQVYSLVSLEISS